MVYVPVRLFATVNFARFRHGDREGFKLAFNPGQIDGTRLDSELIVIPIMHVDLPCCSARRSTEVKLDLCFT